MKFRTKQTLGIFWRHATKYRVSFVLVVVGLVGITLGELYLPFWYKAIFDTLASGRPNLGAALVRIIWIIAAVEAGTWVFRRMSEFTTAFFEARVMSDLLNSSFVYLQRHSYDFFTSRFTGSLVRKVNRFARAFEDIMDEFVYSIGQTALRILGILIVLFVWHWQLALLVLVWTTVFVLFNYRFSLYKLPYDIARADTDTETSGQLADTISNNMNLKLFGGYAAEQQSYARLTEKLYRLRRRSWDLGNISDSVQGLLLIVLEFGLLYAAVGLWEKGRLTIGDFALIQAYLIQIFYRVWDIGKFIRRIFESLADAEEMTEIFLTPHEVQDAPGERRLRVREGGISFEGVRFAYKQNLSVFTDFNLSVPPGQKIAFVGPSGGGKSTIVKLLLRFYDVQSGKILIDGQAIDGVTQDSLRANIAVVPQDPILFHRTLLENIRYAKPDATKEEVIRVAKLAHAHEFIAKFPQGYDTYVGERGIKLSGGERQRVAIARAILKNAPILALDEATSSLDSESEHYIQDALRILMKGRTTIVIAHRLSTIMQMDRIVVLENGAITEDGKHEELLKVSQGTYQRLWDIQAGGFANV